MPQIVRVSIGNLATSLRIPGMDPVFFGIMPKDCIQALGVAAELTPAGVEYLKEHFGARKFEKDKDTGNADARFQIDADQLTGVFEFFRNIVGAPGDLEMDPIRDILAELTGKEFKGAGAILSEDDAASVQIIYQQIASQKPPEGGKGTSERELADIPTRRIFRLYEIEAPREIMGKITKHPMVELLLTGEVRTTYGGAKKGMTEDGKVILDNIFIPE